MRNKGLSLKNEFFLVGLLMLCVISVAVTVFQSLAMYQMGMESATERISGSNRQIAAYMDAQLEGLAATVRIIAASPDVIGGESEDPKSRARALDYFRFVEESNSNVLYCYAGYEDGSLLINDYDIPAGFKATIRPWYLAALRKSPGINIGFPYQDIKTGEWLLSVSETLRSEGEILGVVSVDSSLAGINGMLNRVRTFETQNNYVIGFDGTVLVHQDAKYIGKNIEDLTSCSLSDFFRDSGVITYTLPGVDTRLAYYSRLGITDWILISAANLTEVREPIRNKIIGIITLMLMLSLILGVVQARIHETRFVKPLLALKDRVSDITDGKPLEPLRYRLYNGEIAGLIRNIERMTETSLTNKAYELNLILESASDGILVLSDQMRVIHRNLRFMQLWQIPPRVMGDTFTAETRSRLLQAVMPDYEKFFMNEEAPGEAEATTRIYLKNGIILDQFTCPLIEDGRVTGRLWTFSDVTEKALAEERLKMLAATDDLTGLWNRRYFLGRAEYEISRAIRDGQPLALVFLDIDHFKAINDIHGHAAGDRALEFLATVLTNQLRTTDTIGRIGGEEFAILFPNTEVSGAFTIAEKIRRYFENSSFRYDDQQIGFTVSMGLAGLTPEIKGIDALLLSADIACYKAKEAGRNRVAIR